MGEAKKRARRLQAMAEYCRLMKRERFNLFALGSRAAKTPFLADELSWWSSPCERLIAVISRDRQDQDYLWVLLARDDHGRFRTATAEVSYPSIGLAEEALAARMKTLITSDKVARHAIQIHAMELLVATFDYDLTPGEAGQVTALFKSGALDIFDFEMSLARARIRGDRIDLTDVETRPIPKGLDLLTVPTSAKRRKLHKHFVELQESPARAAARAVFKEIGPWLDPRDPNFVEQFQTTGFDQRLWEIYLWAALHEAGYDVTHPEAPDFHCRSPFYEFCIEATTIGASTDGALLERPEVTNDEQQKAFLDDYMALKFGSSLTSKLNPKGKLRYWEHEVSRDLPLLFAIADFHHEGNHLEPASMTFSHPALWQYLYAIRSSWHYEGDSLVIEQMPIDLHRFGTATVTKEAPSGFFKLPGSENISAVLFTNAGTITKFDRMGIIAGYSMPGILYARMGVRHYPDPNSIVGQRFFLDVTLPDYKEGWGDEINIFHNPHAIRPLPVGAFPDACHHFLKDGKMVSYAHGQPIFTSTSVIIQATKDDGPTCPPDW